MILLLLFSINSIIKLSIPYWNFFSLSSRLSPNKGSKLKMKFDISLYSLFVIFSSFINLK